LGNCINDLNVLSMPISSVMFLYEPEVCHFNLKIVLNCQIRNEMLHYLQFWRSTIHNHCLVHLSCAT